MAVFFVNSVFLLLVRTITLKRNILKMSKIILGEIKMQSKKVAGLVCVAGLTILLAGCGNTQKSAK